MVKVASGFLLRVSFLVTAASSGSEAISALQDTFYDLVVTDITMEGIDGLDVVNQKHRTTNPRHYNYRIQKYKIRQKAISIGVDDFLVKPFEIEELLSSVQLCLNLQNL